VSLVVRDPAPGVRLLLLNRPAVQNAVDLAVVQSLQHAVDAAEPDGVRLLVLGSTTPGAFCSGADLDVPDAERAEISDRLYGLCASLLGLGIPVVAAIDGPAVGGGSQLALAADVRIGSVRATLRFVGPGHGLAVGLWALPATVGRGRALDLVLSQRLVRAEDAVALGLLDRLADDPVAAAISLGSATAAVDAAAVARAKRLTVDGDRLLDRLAAERAGNVAVFTGAVPHVRDVRAARDQGPTTPSDPR
jgi:enoyl-CoA hydratase/carnithine racemase